MTTIVSPKGIQLSQLIVKEDNTGTYIYTGYADSGSVDGDAVWAISRETIADGTLLWKAGEFGNTWTARASGTYQ